jgi:hypothetical protein
MIIPITTRRVVCHHANAHPINNQQKPLAQSPNRQQPKTRQTRNEAQRLYQEVCKMIRLEKGIEAGPETSR